jgi:hypothetical protein
MLANIYQHTNPYHRITVTPVATRLSSLYWKVDYVLSNANDYAVETGLSVYLSFNTVKVTVVKSNGVFQGITLTATTNSLCTFSYIVANHTSVNSVTGIYAGSSPGYAEYWRKGSSVSTYSYPYLVFNWQKVPVLAHSSTNLSILIGHGDPPAGLPTAHPTPLPVPIPDASGFISLNTSNDLAFSFSGVNPLGQNLTFGTITNTTMRVGDFLNFTQSGSSLRTGSVTITKTTKAVTPTWWEVVYNLKNTGTTAVNVDLAVSVTLSVGLVSEVWSPYGTRGFFVRGDLDETNFLIIILRNTSAVTPVNGWWVGLSGSQNSEANLWSSSTNPINYGPGTGHTAFAINWRSQPVHPGGDSIVKFLVGHGNVPRIGDLDEPTQSPMPSQTPFPTAVATATPLATPPPTLTLTNSPLQTPQQSSTVPATLTAPVSQTAPETNTISRSQPLTQTPTVLSSPSPTIKQQIESESEGNTNGAEGYAQAGTGEEKQRNTTSLNGYIATTVLLFVVVLALFIQYLRRVVLRAAVHSSEESSSETYSE